MVKKAEPATGRKGIVQLLRSLEGRYSEWEIWQDFIIMSAVSIANALPGPYREQRETLYLSHASKFQTQELNVFAKALAEVVMELERNPEQDLLGELFMSLGFGSEWKGQFFTPYPVCRAMAAMTAGDGLQQEIQTEGWIKAGDPTCGAGALLIALANEYKRQKINYQTSVLFVAQDIDFLAGCMCYIQLSLLGCAGYVVIDDSLARPATSYDSKGLIPAGGDTVWFTPMYYRDVWQWRRLIEQMKISFVSNEREEDERSESVNEIRHEYAGTERRTYETGDIKGGLPGQYSLFADGSGFFADHASAAG